MRVGPVQRQSLISLSSQLGITAIGYLSTIYFAHALGPAILGLFFLFLAYYGVFDIVGDGGFGGAAVKRISEGREQGSFFSAYIILRLALLGFSVGALLLISPYLIDLGSSGLIPWLVLALIIGTGASILGTGTYGTAKVGVSQVSGFFNTIVKIVVQVAATFLGYAAAGLVGGFVVGMAVGALINLRFLDLPLSRFNMTHIKQLFSFSFWSFLTSGGALVFSYADTILIGYFMTNADVGIYRVAFQLSGVAAFITGALHFVLYPRVSRWHASSDLTTISTAISRAFTYSLFLAVPVAVGGFILADRLMYFLYGAAFEGGTVTLVILLLVQIANIFMYLETMCLNAMNQPRTAFLVTAIASVLNIALNVALIQVLGIAGAAIATLLSMALNAALAYRYLDRLVPVRLERTPVFNIAKASAVMGAAVLAFRLMIPITNVVYLVAAVVIGGVVYFFILFRFEHAMRDEIKEIVLTLGIPWPRFM